MKTDSELELEPDPEPMSELQATQQWRGDANGVWVRVRGRGVAESVGALKMTGKPQILCQDQVDTRLVAGRS